MDIETKIQEAETYYNMGMLDESLSIYKKILVQHNTSVRKSAIEDKIHEIEEQIERRQTPSPLRPITDEILRYLGQPEGEESVADLIHKAKAFQELGIFKEATDIYRQIITSNTASEKIHLPGVVADFFASLLEIVSAKEAVAEIDRLLEGLALAPSAEADSLYRIGLQLEKKMVPGLAADSFRKALSLDPDNEEIHRKASVSTVKPETRSRYDYLLENGVATKGQLRESLSISNKQGKSIEAVLIDRFEVKKEKIGSALSRYYNCPYRAFDPALPVPVELISKLKKPFLIHNGWVPLGWDKNGIEVLVEDPRDLRKTDTIRALMSTYQFRISVGIREDVLQFIDHFYNQKNQDSLEDVLDDLERMIPDVEFEEMEEAEDNEEIIDESSSQVVKFVDQVLITAFRQGVSDIHIEPSPLKNLTTVRFRLDGVCKEYSQVPNAMAPAILSRLKIMANLDIAERRLPQDGKIKMNRKGVPRFELRMSTMPTTNAKEDAVLRILAKAGAMALEDLGLNERNLNIMKKAITQPYGLVLVVGPTGSGKTTTLHSALGYINKPEIKIWTAEDPVEITQAGLRQVESKPRIGLDFARIMRGFLRLDPDVIMIGEMRDQETAAIGVEASLTGHLVFSTLHTNSAPETITRLLDMGLNPLNFSDAFLAVLAQRLIRRLCKNCRTSYRPSKKEFDEIVHVYGVEDFSATRIDYHPKMTLNRLEGCEACSESGYRGRLGIHELMEGTKPVKQLIKEGASTEQLLKQACADGMTSLKQDAIIKMIEGHTEMKEIMRVCVE